MPTFRPEAVSAYGAERLSVSATLRGTPSVVDLLAASRKNLLQSERDVSGILFHHARLATTGSVQVTFKDLVKGFATCGVLCSGFRMQRNFTCEALHQVATCVAGGCLAGRLDTGKLQQADRCCATCIASRQSVLR